LGIFFQGQVVLFLEQTPLFFIAGQDKVSITQFETFPDIPDKISDSQKEEVILH
jgi:hypothetical protein